MPLKIKRFGWIPDLPDHRDYAYTAPRPVLAKLPSKVDLRAKCPKVVYNQGELGSCTANAIAAAIEFLRMKDKLKPIFTPSRLFIYYNERVVINTVNEDSGAMIRDGVKSVAKEGAPPEECWPYDINKFTQKPPAGAYAEGLKYQVLRYMRVARTLKQMKGCLADGYPFVFGFTVYSSFDDDAVAKKGEVQMPAPDDSVLGGHAVLGVGYDDKRERFIVRNSWGAGWGAKGYFTMPYEYLLNSDLSDDFWTIRMVE